VVIAKLAHARPSAADAEYLPIGPVLRSDIPGSATTVSIMLRRGTRQRDPDYAVATSRERHGCAAMKQAASAASTAFEK
jgi:hypothetical protein